MKLLPLFEGIMYKKSQEGKRNEKIVAFIQKRFGGSYPYIDIIDQNAFHNRAVAEAEDELMETGRWNDSDDIPENILHQKYHEVLNKMAAPYKTDYTLHFTYKDGEFIVTWTTPVGHPGGQTFSNLKEKLDSMFHYFGIDTYTIKDVCNDKGISKNSYFYDIHVNGPETHSPFKRDEKLRLPYDPTMTIDPKSGRPI
jgi:hypothetical protein